MLLLLLPRLRRVHGNRVCQALFSWRDLKSEKVKQASKLHFIPVRVALSVKCSSLLMMMLLHC